MKNARVKPPPDLGQVVEGLKLLVEPGQVVELRALKVSRRGYAKPHTEAGFFDRDHLDVMAREALRLTPDAEGCYWTLNPLHPALLARMNNRVDACDSGTLTSDKDVIRRRFLLIDTDPSRPVAGISATDDEKSAAAEVARNVRAFLEGEGWPEPIKADSGNGFHQLYGVDLAAEDGGLVRRVLKALAARFDSTGATIDTGVFNPSRICKLYGTWARKGDSTEDRPHRCSRILSVPEAIRVVTREQLEAVAALLPEPAQAAPRPEAAARPPSGDAIDAYVRKAFDDEVDRVATCPKDRNIQLNKSAFAVGQLVGTGVLDRGEAERQLMTAAATVGLGETEAARTIRSGMEKGIAEPRALSGIGSKSRVNGTSHRRNGKARPDRNGTPPDPGPDEGPAEPGRFPLTDLGNAERLVAHHGRDIRFCHVWKKWLVWDGRRWAVDNVAAVARMAKETVRSIYLEAGHACDGDVKAIARHAVASEANPKIKAMVERAAAEEGVPVLPWQLDRDPWALNTPTGTLDLRTGELRPHRREDLITALSPTPYDPGAECPTWEATLSRIFDGNPDLIGFWQRLCGCILTGTVSEQILPILHGTGANGKSTILNALMDVLGPDYAMKAGPDMLMVRRNESHPTERADLFGKRLCVAIETGEGSRINEALIKELTGSDKIRARRMREDFWEFDPTHKVLLCTNHRPAVRGTDHAIWRRLKLVPFNVTIPDEEQDKRLPAKLAREHPGILAWCVRGCLEWQRSGLRPPVEVVDATAEYRKEEDVLGAFLAEHTMSGASFQAKAAALYERYRQWTERSGESALSQKRFGAAMTERGFERYQNNGTWYRGVGLRHEAPPEDNSDNCPF